MMGPRQEAQPALFCEFSLEDHVPQNHLLRSIDRFVDLSGIRSYLTDFYSHTGRPSVDPELLIRMLLVGYCFGIRSERRLCEEVHLNLAYRRFCRLDLSDRVPDHSTFSKTGTVGSARVSCCATCSRRPLHGASKRAWLADSVWPSMQASSRLMPTSRTRRRRRTGTRDRSIPLMRPEPFASMWTHWTKPHSARRARSSPSSRPIPTPPASGLRPVRARHSSAIPTTTLSTRTMALSLTLRPRAQSGIAKLFSSGRMQPDPSPSGGHLAGIVGPEAESISPCMTIGVGCEAITAWFEEDVDLVMGSEEPLCLPG
ncbi:hypothetical protein KARMA_0567 [Donghicola eburneus]|uniref:Transposase InsH N-terminal domain-containing protein n=1 Tax=Donghicola eburneus TaxID=393278 RepID=A0A1M4MVI7_9RHOB|nr:hypothetical protein KARMA_0567 [Donghicola eburneus]